MSNTSITDPVLLGLVWFVRPRPEAWPVLVTAAIFLGAGALIAGIERFITPLSPKLVIGLVVAINGAATILETGHVAAVIWWLIGSALSALLMWIALRLARRMLTTSIRTAPSYD